VRGQRIECVNGELRKVEALDGCNRVMVSNKTRIWNETVVACLKVLY
jgi:hypothetical protein